MQKYEVRGRDAEAMLNRMVTRDVAKINLNRVAYCVWCTDEGRMIDDGTIFKHSDDHFMLTCGSPCTAWLRKSAFGFDDVTVTDVTDTFAALALQGANVVCCTQEHGARGHRHREALRHQAFSVPRRDTYGVAHGLYG